MSVHPHRQNAKLLSILTAKSVQLFPQRRETRQQKPLIHTHQIDRVCSTLSLDMNRRGPTYEIRFGISRSMKSTHLVAVSPQQIRLPHCQNKLRKWGRWWMPEIFLQQAVITQDAFCIRFPVTLNFNRTMSRRTLLLSSGRFRGLTSLKGSS